jgi:hypothetical protein
MTTDELLAKLPSCIGRNRWQDKDGNVIGYMSDGEDGDMGWLALINEGRHWRASYEVDGDIVCLNPHDEKPPYKNAATIGSTPNEALQLLYDWCVENGFI